MTGSRGLQLAAVCLLILSVLLGPAGLAGAVSLAESVGCGADCPCDEAASEDDRGGDAEATVPAGPDRDSPGDGCPLDCPDCSCCAHAVHAVLALMGPPATATPPGGAKISLAMAPPRSGVLDGVFRPPRSLI